jgi:hypothetical protein
MRPATPARPDRLFAVTFGLALLLFALAALLPGVGSAAAAKPKLGFVKVARADQPTALASPPGYRRLAFVTERGGRVRILRRGHLLKRPLLDLSKKVRSLAIEQGLLGIAFPPNFRRTGRFYLDYTGNGGGSRLVEYRTRRGHPTSLVPGSRRMVIHIARVNSHGNHNGGHLAFRGNLLYIGVGDGYDPGDLGNLAQNLTSLRGKILRIDPRPDRGGSSEYRIPAGNPLVGERGRDEIFAWGFRNPHNFDFTRSPGGTQMMLVTDVGQDRFEELNYLPLPAARGGNFGWKKFEGLEPYNCGELCPNGADPGSGEGLIWPQLVYPHDEGCAIIGGPVVRDRSLTSIAGRIIYGDFCTNRIRTAAPDQGTMPDDRPTGVFLPPGPGRYTALNGFGADGYHRIYALSNFGGIYRIVQR